MKSFPAQDHQGEVLAYFGKARLILVSLTCLGPWGDYIAL
jgi:hypothetical protein